VSFKLTIVKEFLAAPFLRASIQPLPMSHKVLSVSNQISKHLQTLFNLTNVLLWNSIVLHLVRVRVIFKRLRTSSY